jgi:phenylpyruvate tautomerase PptA (4-oxalocrotonate tautomerase family)
MKMPMLELTCPENSLDQQTRDKLMRELTDCLLRWEGAPVENPVAQAISWGFVYDQPRSHFYVGGVPLKQDHYRLKVSVPEGVLDEGKKEGLIGEATALIQKHAGEEHDPFRTWVLVREIAEGNWGGDGKVNRRRDIVKAVYAK